MHASQEHLHACNVLRVSMSRCVACYYNASQPVAYDVDTLV